MTEVVAVSSLEWTHIVAVILALGAAICAAATNLFVRKGTDEGTAVHAVLVVMCCNIIVLVPIVAIIYYPTFELTTQSWIAFIAAGLVGTLTGRAFKYSSIEKIGASRTTPITSSWALISTVLGIIILSEAVALIHGIGVVLIVGGVAAITWETSHENPDDLSRTELLIGLLIPFGAAFAYGLEPIFANFGFAEGTPAPVGLVVKTITATLGFTLYLRWRGMLPTRRVLRSGDMRWFILAGIANTLFLLGYYLSLEIAPVSVVTPIIVSSTLFVIILSALFMPARLERVTWKLFVAATIVVAGVLIITMYG